LPDFPKTASSSKPSGAVPPSARRRWIFDACFVFYTVMVLVANLWPQRRPISRINASVAFCL
jgi:hypothetical protein